MTTSITGTRREILELLKTRGPQTAAAIAKPLGVTAMAVRQHLWDLRDEKLVEETSRPGGVGRPAKIWSLTEDAERYFPDAHAELAVGLIGALRESLGPEAMDAVIAARAKQQLENYRAAMADCGSLAAKLEALAGARTAEGYMATVESDGDDLLFLEHHCPICAAARVCQGLCAMELDVFRDCLGPSVEVERTDHILAGARRCAYRVTPRAA